MGRVAVTAAVIVCLAWAGAVAYSAWLSWPHLSLDLSHGDPATQSAHSRAVMLHVTAHAAVALAPLVVIAVFSWITGRRT